VFAIFGLYETIRETQAFYAFMEICHRNVTINVLESFFGDTACVDTTAPALLPFSPNLFRKN